MVMATATVMATVMARYGYGNKYGYTESSEYFSENNNLKK